MNLDWIIPALLIGSGGSLHCVGMCGPLMFTSLYQKGENGFSIKGWLAYQTGRISIYVIWGILFGWIGSSLKWIGIQQNISLSIGIAILFTLMILNFFPSFEQKISKSSIFRFVRSFFFNSIHSKLPTAKFMGGILNGMLPCGLVYVALAGASASQDPWRGAMFMLFFGLGTLPMLSAVWLGGNNLSISLRSRLNRWYPLVIGCMAIMLILRGMNLGNMFSPAMNKAEATVLHCAEK